MRAELRSLLWLTAALLGACATAGPNPGFALLEQGDAKGAEQAFREALEERPGDARLTAGLGAALAAQGRYDRACRLLRRGSEPLSRQSCWLEAIESASDNQRWARILIYWDRIDPDDWPPEERASLYEKVLEAGREAKRWGLLLDVYPRLLAMRPGDATLHYRYARTLELRRRNDEALREYELAYSLDPDNRELERYIKKQRRIMQQTGESGAARVERFDPGAGDTEAATAQSEFSVESWSGGAMNATIEIESMAEERETTAVPIEVLKAHWPDGVSAVTVKRSLGRLVAGLDCPHDGAGGHLVVTLGPQGTVEKIGYGGDARRSRSCLQREIREWYIADLSGGYLRIRVPFPIPTTGSTEAER